MQSRAFDYLRTKDRSRSAVDLLVDALGWVSYNPDSILNVLSASRLSVAVALRPKDCCRVTALTTSPSMVIPPRLVCTSNPAHRLHALQIGTQFSLSLDVHYWMSRQ